MGFGFWGLWALALGFRALAFGFRVLALGFGGLGCRVLLGLRLKGFSKLGGCRIGGCFLLPSQLRRHRCGQVCHVSLKGRVP